MNLTKIILYILAVPFSIWILESINLNQIFKKNRELQARLVYFVLTISISYLIVNFFIDFYQCTVGI